MTKRMKKTLLRIIIGAVIFAAGLILKWCHVDLGQNGMLILFLAAYIIVGGDVVKEAAENIIHGQLFDENFLMAIATIGAFFVSDYPEAVAVMLFYQVGEWFQSYAVNRSRKSIAELMDIRPDYANVRRNGEVVKVDPDEVAIGDVIIVKPGEKVPLDGVILKGNSTLDTKALTGESVPREVLEGEKVISGCINLSGLLEVSVEKAFGESTVSKILELVENASSKKAETENFITRFAKFYTPIVVGLAVLLAVIPPLVFGQNWYDWIYRALNFLVISCPCALVISIPLGFFGGIGGASKHGILIKGSNYLELLSKTEIVVMDKTGTLTKGTFEVVDLKLSEDAENKGITKEDVLHYAAYAENFSSHPISVSLRKAYGKDIDQACVEQVEEIAGHGVKAVVDGHSVMAGNTKWLEEKNIKYLQATETGTVVHMVVDETYAGYILIADEIKEDAARAISAMKENHVAKVVMLTGDREATAAEVAGKIGIDEYHSELLPGDKVDCMEKLMQEKSTKGKLAFVGDGINDAPVLARADIGIAMGGLGSDAAIEAADIVIMTDEPSKIALAMKISAKTLRIVKENIIFALVVKCSILLLAAFGFATMWAAVFADVGVAFIAILNAMRSMRIKE